MSVKEENLSLERVKELLSYDPESGLFVWLSGRSRGVGGKVAGWKLTQGHIAITIDGKTFYAHRLAWFISHGVWPVAMIDHINGIGHDNRLLNLRSVERSINAQNQRKASKNNKLGILGVVYSPRHKKYVAHIQIPGLRQKTIGYYHSADEAHNAYVQEKRRVHAGCTI